MSNEPGRLLCHPRTPPQLGSARACRRNALLKTRKASWGADLSASQEIGSDPGTGNKMVLLGVSIHMGGVGQGVGASWPYSLLYPAPSSNAATHGSQWAGQKERSVEVASNYIWSFPWALPGEARPYFDKMTLGGFPVHIRRCEYALWSRSARLLGSEGYSFSWIALQGIW